MLAVTFFTSFPTILKFFIIICSHTLGENDIGEPKMILKTIAKGKGRLIAYLREVLIVERAIFKREAIEKRFWCFFKKS